MILPSASLNLPYYVASDSGHDYYFSYDVFLIRVWVPVDSRRYYSSKCTISFLDAHPEPAKTAIAVTSLPLEYPIGGDYYIRLSPSNSVIYVNSDTNNGYYSYGRYAGSNNASSAPCLKISLDSTLSTVRLWCEEVQLAYPIGVYDDHAVFRTIGGDTIKHSFLRNSDGGDRRALIRYAMFSGRPVTLQFDRSIFGLPRNTSGLTKATAKRKDLLDRLHSESPLSYVLFEALQIGTTVNGVNTNTLIAAFLRITDTYEGLVAGIELIVRKLQEDPTQHYSTWYRRNIDKYQIHDALCALPGAAEIVESAAAKKDFSKYKELEKRANALLPVPDRYPKLYEAVASGSIPTTVFKQPGDRGVTNTEFPLWERALERDGWSETLYKIAAAASTRNTYERNITAYLSFLFQIEKYLYRHTGRVWTSMPKLVSSSWELEMSETEGTTKRRSALTPVADNDKNVITVPYVSLSVGGARTQYCYTNAYYLFQEGFIEPDTKSPVLNELEVGLNGRDDYGLCYYTLTGTVTARGYPTFLIIFERLLSRNFTRVHFHRVHPCTTTDGRNTLAHEQIERCYQYMTGNVPAELVTAQQGDLVFIKLDNDPVKAGSSVDSTPMVGTSAVFESHHMLSDAGFSLYWAQNKNDKTLLGYIENRGSLSVVHPEHERIDGLSPGWYAVRRCRSFEANPVSIWSLTID